MRAAGAGAALSLVVPLAIDDGFGDFGDEPTSQGATFPRPRSRSPSRRATVAMRRT